MDEGWFYAEGEKPTGPVTTAALLAALRNMLDPGKVKVWHAGFSDWRDVKDVPQLSDQLLRPPPLVAAKLERTSTRSSEVEPQDAAMKLPKNTRRRVVSLVALVAIVVLGSIFSSVAFDRPLEGIAYLAGEFAVYAGALYLLSLPWRRTTYRAAIVMLLAASAVGLSNRQKLLDSFAVEDVKTALQQARTPEQIGKALEQNPSNPLLQLITKATNAASETGCGC
jgi:GYF domain 2